MSKIKSDSEGLFIQCDGWIGRPPKSTRAIVGMTVRATHPAGNIICVRFEPRGKPECWWIQKLSPEAARAFKKERRG